MHAGGEYGLERRIGWGVGGRFFWLSELASSCAAAAEGEGWGSGMPVQQVTKKV